MCLVVQVIIWCIKISKRVKFNYCPLLSTFYVKHKFPLLARSICIMWAKRVSVVRHRATIRSHPRRLSSTSCQLMKEQPRRGQLLGCEHWPPTEPIARQGSLIFVLVGSICLLVHDFCGLISWKTSLTVNQFQRIIIFSVDSIYLYFFTLN